MVLRVRYDGPSTPMICDTFQQVKNPLDSCLYLADRSSG